MLSEKVDKNGSTFDTRRGLPLTRKRTPFPALLVIFIIFAPWLNSKNRNHVFKLSEIITEFPSQLRLGYSSYPHHVLKLSEIIQKDGGYMGDFKFSTGLPPRRDNYFNLTCTASVVFVLHTGATKRSLKTSGYHQNHYLYLISVKKTIFHCTIIRLWIYLKL